MLSAARHLSRLPSASAIGQTRSMGGSQSFVSAILFWYDLSILGYYDVEMSWLWCGSGLLMDDIYDSMSLLQ